MKSPEKDVGVNGNEAETNLELHHHSPPESRTTLLAIPADLSQDLMKRLWIIR
jgi:hypothetical protein